jgi:predicted lipoprotein with Yx(FWY)xxD motif
MRRTPILASTLLASVLLSACGSSSSKTTSSSSAAAGSETTSTAASQSSGAGEAVKTASNSSVGGTILVNAQGLTLYRLTGERSGKFICTTSACTQVWHPLTATSEATPTGSVGSLSTVKRPDGTLQVAYKGEPLYTFSQDTKAGQTGGQGVKDVGTWEVVTASASSSASGAASAPSTSSAPEATTSKESEAPKSGGGGYGY